MTTRLRPSACAMVVLAATALAGGTPAVASAAPVLGDRQDGARVQVASGAVVDVRLTANLATGFAWRMLGRAPELRLVGQRYDPPPHRLRPVLLLGRPGVQTFRVKIDAPPGRRLALRFAYRRWWTKVGLGRVWTATLVTVASPR